MSITTRILVVGAITLGTAATPTVRAQYTADFQTNTISGVVSNWSGNYNVGNSFSMDALLIRSNGVLTSGGSYLGFNPSNTNNSVLITGSGSTWSNGFLYVGFEGIGNSLILSNGGRLINSMYSYVGGGSIPKLGNNSVVVTGSSSVWSNSQDLTVGEYVAANTVVVSGGGVLIDNNAYLGASAPTASNNNVWVNDSGSVWTNRGDLRVGTLGLRCSLTISNGGKVFNGLGIIGDSSLSGNGTVTVIGSGSIWTNRNDLNVGRSAARNSLVILSSGTVCSLNGLIGYSASASNNSVVASGAGSVWYTLGTLHVGDSGAANSLVVSNGAQVLNNGTGYLGLNSTSGNNSVWVSDGGSVWGSGGDLFVGGGGGSNSVVISNGAKIFNNNGTVGSDSTSKNNQVLVTGSGSVWSNSNILFMGGAGPGNSLVISNGGQVADITGFVGYYASSSSNNSVVVSGSGSVWKNLDDVTIGFSGSSNSLVINNGGQVIDGSGIIGSGSSKNSVLVSGVGSVWSNANNLYVGQNGGNNSLTIQLTVGVLNQDAYIGYGFGSSNSVRVLGDINGLAATRWQAGVLHVGEQGSANSLMISGSVVSATNLIVGVASATCDNFVQLDASGVLAVTNATHDAVLEVRNGELILNSGTVRADILVMTNACGRFIRNGGTVIVGSLVLDPAMDADGDGLPNGWEQQYGLDPLDANGVNGPNGDPDGDGLNNLQEFLGGGNPVVNIQSVTREGNDIRVTWGAALGKTNALQATDGDVDGSYSNNFADIFVVNGSVSVITNYLDVGAATNSPTRYYRVRLVP